MHVTAEQIRAARKADLYDYLRRSHPDEIKVEGHWIRLKSNPSICLKEGLGGYKDYASLETGNSIDFLTRHLNYDFVTAVSALTTGRETQQARPPGSISLPEKGADCKRIRSYLTGRGFTEKVFDRLVEKNLLYEDIRGNAVFRSAGGDFFELRGTRPGLVFHQCGKVSPERFWCFVPDDPPRTAFICESAIDAVSLYLLHLMIEGKETTACAYCGIAGVANQKAIERIQKRIPAVIAVDNDEAGQQCRLRNRQLKALIPRRKDWNEELLEMLARTGEH